METLVVRHKRDAAIKRLRLLKSLQACLALCMALLLIYFVALFGAVVFRLYTVTELHDYAIYSFVGIGVCIVLLTLLLGPIGRAQKRVHMYTEESEG